MVSFQPRHSHFAMVPVKPEGKRVRFVRQIRYHEEAEESPRHGDDRVDDK